jgi:hypothetical protein
MSLDVYHPINVPKPVAEDVWVVDGPVMQAGPGGLIPVTIRMVVVRLPDGGLWLHSPLPLDAGLMAALQALGPIRHLVAPNLAHNSFIADWQHACPEAIVHAVRGVRSRLARQGRTLRVDNRLSDTLDPPWGDAFAMLLARGSAMDEAVFFHRASRTLILTDLVERLEPDKMRSRLLRLFAWAAGVSGPSGGAPRYYRLTFLGERRAQLREAVRTMLAWNPERVIFAHGSWFERDGAARLRQAFRWLRI